ncbi:hypothetical protein UNDKW_1655 [Undibacterium sp. KW1]|uniref:hypothetical protein n=1 Tax=Undibacterium sp. KW1 TaxID=2058624 RepID=UPI001331E40D|nr:hypothetical protein [Undibacterium sp. KW1]BBB59928.1 hypothetical protein UNDKW_1655 [Undibacterium sp. KW1]
MTPLERDSSAYQRLKMLIDVGGASALPIKTDPMRAYQIEVLLDYGYVSCCNRTATVTAAGYDYVAVTESQSVEEVVAQVKAEQINRPYFSARPTVSARPYRPGSEDYKKVPSLHTANVTVEKTVNEHGNPVKKINIGSVIRKLPSGEVIS